jgi:hypothetical protein
MSGLRVNNLRGAPTFPDGVVVTGVTTSTSFSGNLTGNVTGSVTGIVTGNVTGNVSGTSGSFSGNVSVGGTLSYGDVTNVDSVGVITARGGIKIGAGQSVSAVSGIITYYGDGSQLDGIESGFSNFVASGTIANGQTVVLTSDGKAVGVASTAPNFNITAFQSNNAVKHVNVAYVGNNKVVIAFEDQPSGSRGAAVVGTISGSSISFGTVVEFDSSYSYNTGIVYDSDSDKVVIVYRDSGSSNYSKAIVGTVSGTSINFGSPVEFGGNTYTNIPIRAVFDSSNNKVVVVYQDANNSNRGTARVGTVSGNSISFGSAVVFESQSVGNWISAAFDSTNNKVVIAYDDGGNSNYGTAIVGTVSGTSISFGTAVVFESASIYYHHMAFDSTNDKVIIAYRDDGNSEYGTAIVGTVSGTSISFGSPTVFESGRSDTISVAYDSTNDKVVISYKDNPNDGYGTVIRGSVSGTSINFDTPIVFHSDSTEWTSIAYDSGNSKLVVAYRDNENDLGEAVVVDSTTLITTNLTSTNYIGIAAEAISNGATGKVTIAGGVNSGQTGLTTARTQYVQGDGSLGTSAGSPSVVAGTSISGTQIIVKG